MRVVAIHDHIRCDSSGAWYIVTAGVNLRQADFSAVLQQVAAGNATGLPAGSPFGPSGFNVNCPVVSLDVNVSR
jgi:hypothetical protein